MDIFKLVAKLGLDTSEYEQGLNDSEEKANGFGSKLGSALSTAAKVGVAAIGTATGAAVSFAKSALDVGSQFDSSMSQVAATLGLTMDDIENNVDGAGDKFEALRAKAQEMGAATNFSASEAADGLNILAMSGFSAEDSMAMLEDVLHLAAAGGMSMAEAASFVSGAMKGFNDSTKDSGYYADLMAKGATLANTSVSQLGEAMSSGAAGAAAYAQTQESMTVALLRLAEQGEVGSAAGTALAAAMKNLYTPTDQAKDALTELGVNAFDPITHKARDFNTVVNELDAALSQYDEETQASYKSTIFGIQGLDAFNKMTVTGTAKQLEWAEALAQASDGTGEAAKQYDTMTDNLQGDIDIWNSALDGFKIVVSDQLMPTIREFVGFASTGLGDITKAFQEGGLDGAMQAFGQVLSDGLAMIIEKIPMMVEAGMQLLSALGQGIMDNLPTLLEAAVQVITMLAGYIIQSLPGLINAALEIIMALANGIIDALPELIPTIVDVMITIVETLIDNVDQLVDAAVEIMIALSDAIIDNLPTLIEKAPELVQKLVDAIIRNTPKLLNAATEIIAQLVVFLVRNFPKIVEAAGRMVTDFVRGIINVKQQVEDAGVQIIQKVWDGIKSLNPIDWGRDLINGFISGIGQGIDGLAQTAANIAGTVRDYIGFSEPDKGPLSNFHTYAPDMMKLFAKGIEDNEKLISDQLKSSFDFENELNPKFGLKKETSSIVMNVYGAKGQDVNELADIVMKKLTWKTQQDRRAWA